MTNRKGITLIALIITIIVMLILAGIAINFSVGEEGIISKAQVALREMERAEVEDIIVTSYVYKTTASMNINGRLDLEETSKAIYSNLTQSGYKVKTTSGEEAGSYEDIYTEGANSISLNVEGKQGTYKGTVETSGLKDEIKIVEDTENEVPPKSPEVEEKYLTLSTNADQIFTTDFKSIYGSFGTSQLANLAKLVYKSGEDTIEIVNDRTDTMGTTYLVRVKYYKNNQLNSIYTLRGSSMYFSDDGTAKEGFTCHYYPHYSIGWSDNVQIGVCTCGEHPGTIVYGSLSETDFPKFTGEWEIDEVNSNDYGKQYLTNVLVEK